MDLKIKCFIIRLVYSSTAACLTFDPANYPLIMFFWPPAIGNIRIMAYWLFVVVREDIWSLLQSHHRIYLFTHFTSTHFGCVAECVLKTHTQTHYTMENGKRKSRHIASKISFCLSLSTEPVHWHNLKKSNTFCRHSALIWLPLSEVLSVHCFLYCVSSSGS